MQKDRIKMPGGGGHSCKENFLENLFFLKIFKQAQGVRVRDFNALSIERQNEAVPCRRLTQEMSGTRRVKGAKFPRKNKISSNCAEILSGGNKGCQILSFGQNFGRDLNLSNQSKAKAFTLAEILITLAIIGVVAALTIPSVLKNCNDKKYNTARLKALKTFGEAGKMASINGEINGQANARAFAENVLSKYLKIAKICDNDKAAECNFPSQIQPSNPAADKFTSDNLKAWGSVGIGTGWNARFDKYWQNENFSIYLITADGFSAKLFYNPICVRNRNESTRFVDMSCMNVIYDMNGIKGPNHVGDDIGFVTVFWSGLNTTSVAPGIMPYSEVTDVHDRATNSALSRNEQCAAKNKKGVIYTLPSIDELTSLCLNKNLSSVNPDDSSISGTQVIGQSGQYWAVRHSGYQHALASHNRFWCVRR